MFLKKITLVSIAIFFLHFSSFSQTEEENPDIINQTIERIAEQSDLELDYTELIENLRYYIEHPINLNKTNSDELKSLGLLNDIQITNLLNHIEKNGSLISMYELQSISAFDLKTIYIILPFVKIDVTDNKQRYTLKEIRKYGTSQLFVRYSQTLENQEGYRQASDSLLETSPNARYLGSPYKLYTRYRFQYYNQISVGATAEKDAGEEFFKGSQKRGFDFYSAHVFIKDISPFKTLAIGDYNLQFGQGLTLWSGLAFGKSGDGTFIKKSARGITPFTSVDENRFMRGLAVEKQIKDFRLFVFASKKKLDANTISAGDSLNGETSYITSLQESGLHNTTSTVEDKDAISETLLGGRVEYKRKKLGIGATTYFTRFSDSLQAGNSLYEYYRFSGIQNTIAGIDYSYLFKNYNFFGETSFNPWNGGWATLNGIMAVTDKNMSFSILHRYFAKDYHVVYASPLQEGSSVSNEHALLVGYEFRFATRWSLNGYIDLFRFPWLNYRVDRPSEGKEIIFQLNYRPNKRSLIYFRYRQENKNINSSETYFNIVVPTIKQSYRFNVTFPISTSFSFKSRAEYLTYNDGSDGSKSGFLLTQTLSYRKPKSPFSANFTFAVFDTDSYDERLYAFENDVLYAYSIPAYYYKGIRYIINLKYNIVRNLDLWVRYARTEYSNRNEIGSGLDLIEEKHKSEVKIQLRYKF